MYHQSFPQIQIFSGKNVTFIKYIQWGARTTESKKRNKYGLSFEDETTHTHPIETEKGNQDDQLYHKTESNFVYQTLLIYTRYKWKIHKLSLF